MVQPATSRGQKRLRRWFAGAASFAAVRGVAATGPRERDGGTADAALGRMLSKDRAVLRNLVIAIVASTGALLGIGTFLLGRDRARPQQENTEIVGQQGSVRSSAGGVPPAPVGTTTITSGQLERGASASGPAGGAPTGSPAAQGPATHAPAMQGPAMPSLGGLVALPPMEQAAPHTHANPPAPPPAPPPAQVRGNPAPTPMATPSPMPAPPPAAPAPSPSSPSPITGVAPMGAPPNMAGAPSFAAPSGQQQQQQPQQRAPVQNQAGAGPFTTEPSPFNASAFSNNPEAGAGSFATDPSQAPR